MLAGDASCSAGARSEPAGKGVGAEKWPGCFTRKMKTLKTLMPFPNEHGGLGEPSLPSARKVGTPL